MRLDYALIAEAAAQDSRGALTLIALDQAVAAAAALPVPINRVVAIRAIEERDELGGTDITVRFTVTSPAGDVVAASTASGKLGPRPYPDIPASLNVQMAVTFPANAYGRYVISVYIATSTDEKITAEIPVYVVRPEVRPPEASLSPEGQAMSS